MDYRSEDLRRETAARLQSLRRTYESSPELETLLKLPGNLEQDDSKEAQSLREATRQQFLKSATFFVHVLLCVLRVSGDPSAKSRTLVYIHTSMHPHVLTTAL